MATTQASAEVQYLTDQDGKTRAVVLPIEIWRRLLPREDPTLEELNEAVEDYCLGKAMDEGRRTALLSRDEALEFLESRGPKEVRYRESRREFYRYFP